MKTEKIYDSEQSAACYFRTAAALPNRKILLQITKKCNLRCTHCFVSSNSSGQEMSFEQISTSVLPALLNNNISKVTLTGGEPLTHPNITEIVRLLCSNNFSVSICTNASLINEVFLDEMCDLQNIHFNVSLDGFSSESHGRFRGNNSKILFESIITDIENLSKRKLLNGILVTPNKYSSVEEYVNICDFAKRIGANYVLFNPLSEFGRGQYSHNLGLSSDKIKELQIATQKFNTDELELVYIRFPDGEKALGKCALGRFPYVFTNGDIAICPYMAFAAKNEVSKYNPSSFIVANIFETPCNFEKSLNEYRLPNEETTSINMECGVENCSRGCLAAKIAQGLSILDCDKEICLNRSV